MRAHFQVVDDKDVQISMTFTLTVREWKQLRGQLREEWPSWPLAAMIRDGVDKFEAQMTVEAHAP